MTHTPSNTARLLILAIGFVLCAIVAVCVAIGAARALHWLDTGEAIRPAVLGGVCLLAGAMLSLPILAAGLAGRGERLGPCVVASGIMRALLGLGASLALVLLLKTDGRTLFASFLCGALLALAIETAWAMNILKHPSTSSTGSSAGDSA